ncbi:hypothetical protein EVG20_g5877 [Dentipellis fragilis]|uniref:Uncharacterized protein n=1 Tax=Dentipellis fragilis TaxID=205917 RepID=A0A4Y9YSW6_9AGAM|nr:hypothetical protein EVG20_g5877 [Dentipellis fragilis]
MHSIRSRFAHRGMDANARQHHVWDASSASFIRLLLSGFCIKLPSSCPIPFISYHILQHTSSLIQLVPYRMSSHTMYSPPPSLPPSSSSSSSPRYTVFTVGLELRVHSYDVAHPRFSTSAVCPNIPTVALCSGMTPDGERCLHTSSSPPCRSDEAEQRSAARARLAAVQPIRHYVHGETSEDFEEESRWAGDKRQRIFAGIRCLPAEDLQMRPAVRKIRTTEPATTPQPPRKTRRRVVDRFDMKVKQIMQDSRRRRRILEDSVDVVVAGEEAYMAQENVGGAETKPTTEIFDFGKLVPTFLVKKERPEKVRRRRANRVQTALNKYGPAWGAVFRKTYTPIPSGRVCRLQDRRHRALHPLQPFHPPPLVPDISSESDESDTPVTTPPDPQLLPPLPFHLPNTAHSPLGGMGIAMEDAKRSFLPHPPSPTMEKDKRKRSPSRSRGQLRQARRSEFAAPELDGCLGGF